MEEQIPGVLREAHEGPASGHMGPDTTARKVLLSRLWWPTLYNDARELVVGCYTCQRAGKLLKRDFMPLNPSHAQELFERWGLDFIGPLKASRARSCRYIVVVTEYLTKWAKARALPDNSTLSTTRFIYKHIITQYGIPIQLTSDRGGHFVNHVVILLTTEFKIFHSLSSLYYSRANGQEEAKNKILVSIIYKSYGVEQEDWEEKLPSVLWAYRTTYKVTTRQTPFQFMYGQEAIVPAEFMVPSLHIAIENRFGDMESLRERLYALGKLDEWRMMAQWATKAAQQRRKLWHDKHIRRMKFSPSQWVLKYNGRNEIKPGKFKVRWLGPYKIREVGENGAIRLSTLDDQPIPEPMNKSKLIIYHQRRQRGDPVHPKAGTGQTT